jgi:hypothetical protein
VVSVNDPYGRILLFLSSSSSVVLTRLSGPRSRPTTFFFPGSAGNRTRASGSVARNSDHRTTEAVSIKENTLVPEGLLVGSLVLPSGLMKPEPYNKGLQKWGVTCFRARAAGQKLE